MSDGTQKHFLKNGEKKRKIMISRYSPEKLSEKPKFAVEKL